MKERMKRRMRETNTNLADFSGAVDIGDGDEGCQSVKEELDESSNELGVGHNDVSRLLASIANGGKAFDGGGGNPTIGNALDLLPGEYTPDMHLCRSFSPSPFLRCKSD